MKGGIVHDIAGIVHPAGDPLMLQMGDGRGRRAKEQRRDAVGEDAIDLLRHLPVEAAQAGLDMIDRDVQLGRGESAGQS